MSCSVQMFGWLSDAIACASRSKRCFISRSSAQCKGSTLMATVRSSRVSRARYTSPMPPAPTMSRISNVPSRVPAASVIALALSFLRLHFRPVADDGQTSHACGKSSTDTAAGDAAVEEQIAASSSLTAHGVENRGRLRHALSGSAALDLPDRHADEHLLSV